MNPYIWRESETSKNENITVEIKNSINGWAVNTSKDRINDCISWEIIQNASQRDKDMRNMREIWRI